MQRVDGSSLVQLEKYFLINDKLINLNICSSAMNFQIIPFHPELFLSEPMLFSSLLGKLLPLPLMKVVSQTKDEL